VAAQLGTLPLSLYYFHQFPVYFWLAGWVVVLGGAVFLWGGFLLVLLNALAPPWLADWLGWCLYQLVWGMNQIIQVIQQLPGSVWSGIWLEGWLAALLAFFIGLFPWAVAKRNPRLLLATLGLLSVWGLVHAQKKYETIHQKKLTLYHTNRHFLLDCFAGEKQFSWSDSLNPRQERFAAQTNRWACGIRETAALLPGFEDSLLYWQPPFLQFFEKKLLVVGRQFRAADRAGPPVAVDVLILYGNPGIRLEDCLRQFPCSLVVFAASNSRRRVERWKTTCRAHGVAFYDVGEQGAWVVDIP